MKNIKQAFLKKRGFESEAELSEPSTGEIENLEKMVDQIHHIAETKSWVNIAAFTDYDADGILSAAILNDFITRHLGIQLQVIVPDRSIGYGLQGKYLSYVDLDELDYMFLVDNGVSAIDAISYLNSRGIETLVVDHHLQTEENVYENRRHTMVNVNSLTDKYSFKGLCGSSTLLKVIERYSEKYEQNSEYIEKYRVLAGIATVTDTMPVIGENRELINNAVKSINKNEHVDSSLLHLIMAMERAGIVETNHQYTDVDFGWKIGPTLNADSRVHNEPDIAYDLFVFKLNEADSANQLIKTNELRKAQTKSMTEQSNSLSESSLVFMDGLGNDTADFSSSLAGLLAARLNSSWKRPVLVLQVDATDKYKFHGSARTWLNFGLVDNFDNQELRDLGLSIAGHDAAAGVSIEFDKNQDLAAQKLALETKINEIVDAFEFVDVKNFDFDAVADGITIKNVEELDELRPFGNLFEAPVFSVHGRVDNKPLSPKHPEHLKTTIGGITVIWWNGISEAERNDLFGKNLTLFGELSINEWRGKKSLQFIVGGYEFAEDKDESLDLDDELLF